MHDAKNHLHLERHFLEDVGHSLTSALFIIDRLSEEIREEEARLEDDPEIGRLFSHLLNDLQKIDKLVKSRRFHLSELADEELRFEKNKKGSSLNSPP